MSVDDAELLRRARKGNEGALMTLFERYQRRIYHYAVYMCGRQHGDDIVQDTFLVVLRQKDRDDALGGTVGGYLFGIARHLAMKRVAAENWLPGDSADETSGDELAADAPTILETLTREETIAAVRAAVESLPSRYREVIVLCELQEMSYVDVADLLRCPIGTVRSRLHRARGMLTSKLAAVAGGSRRSL